MAVEVKPFFNRKTNAITDGVRRYEPVTKCYVTRGHIVFMTTLSTEC